MNDMSKTILANVDGFTPVIDTLVDELGLMSAAVFGRIWRYCQMEDGVCKASLESIAKWIGVDKATVMRHAKVLCENGYLKDLTPDLRNRPHVYADTGKAGISIQLSGVAHSKAKKGAVAENNTGVAQCNVTVAESQLNKESKKDSKKQGDLVDGMLAFQKATEQDKPSLDDFERSLGFGNLPWYSSSTWEKFRRFVVRVSAANPNIWKDYAAWRLDGGKYKAFSNRKIRENPAAFMDTGYPEYEASKMYRKPVQLDGSALEKYA